ncbi:MAG TPA: recombinase family protein [Acidimicrobiales bacterium]|nr:recombinase family protein [Acidimicrobiales bacterium]
MLTVAYCRVSTDEQAEEGFSIEGQVDKLRAYSALHDLGEVMVITDPGLSGKNLKRSGLQELLAMVEVGHVRHVLVWRLDRLSRNLGDLILLANKFAESGVALHSVSENLDLSSAAGRMFYNILGTFAQYFREQLSENVKMGNERAVKEGTWINRPKTGYDLVEGELIANCDAVRVQECFRLRAKNYSYRAIEERTGFNYSLVCSILKSRVYLGEVLHNDVWSPGRHEAIVTEKEWNAAHRGLKKGVQPSNDLLSSRVICGLCERRMVVTQNGKGSVTYRCWHRGQGCSQPARSNKGLVRAAVLGMGLLGNDERLQETIRKKLAGGSRRHPGGARRGRRPPAAVTLGTLSEERGKLLRLYYEGGITVEGFREEEQRLVAAIEAAREQSVDEQLEDQALSDLEMKFEQVATLLRELDIDMFWESANVEERRVLIHELIEWVKVFPDHLEVKVVGAPQLNVMLGEVGLKVPEIVGVGDGT